jgi:O-antigen/teichoic acid export membrane protein
MKKDLSYFKNLFFSHLPIFKNTFWLYLSEIFSKVFHLILFFVAARVLGKEVFGVFNYVLALVSFYFLFSDFGVSQLLIRDYLQMDDKKSVFWLFDFKI